MLLDKEAFSDVIKNTPLISIDLVVESSDGKVLLGKRINEPAKGFWFVPGGRIFKDESLDAAFERTVKEEIGLDLKREDAAFIGVYEHFYDNNVFDNKFGTHYIVLGHKIVTDEKLSLNNQHEKYEWFEKELVLKNKDVHKYAKDYFKGNK
ncbi:GDP-mannose mannosyl hydrolase [Sulfurimonas sp.]